MLSKSDVIAFVATANAERAKSFYTDILGLPLVNDGPFALEFDVNGALLRVAKLESFTPAQHTVLGWRVVDIDATVDALATCGLAFERIEGMPQDDRGVWQSPDGAKVAWFKDPDRNMLSLTELPTARTASE